MLAEVMLHLLAASALRRAPAAVGALLPSGQWGQAEPGRERSRAERSAAPPGTHRPSCTCTRAPYSFRAQSAPVTVNWPNSVCHVLSLGLAKPGFGYHQLPAKPRSARGGGTRLQPRSPGAPGRGCACVKPDWGVAAPVPQLGLRAAAGRAGLPGRAPAAARAAGRSRVENSVISPKTAVGERGRRAPRDARCSGVHRS